LGLVFLHGKRLRLNIFSINIRFIVLFHDFYLLCCGWARKNPQCLISMFVLCCRYYFLVFVWHVRTVKLLMISGASRSPLMTAFAELI
jgi:hypothetical protein